ncbi:MAG: hypothetical protein LRZ97_01440 [Candidatus Pacebacteria bacterium]|nr:hypothetical protein [Candidatus Paceibacterota bacterium]
MSKRWSNKMRTIYITGLLLIFVAMVIPSVLRYINKPLTCNDGVQNQGETAIDLGGPCHFLNPADLKPLVHHWARSFEVSPGIYSSVSYIENPNSSAGVRRVSYIFKLYDEDGIFITEKKGSTFISPGKVVPIFEGNFQVGVRKPLYTKFSFTEPMIWEKMQSTLSAEVFVVSESFKNEGGQPNLSAEIQNRGVYTLRQLVVVATLFDTVGNALGSSRTIIDRIPADSTKKVVFTWPKSFDDFVAKIDIVPLLPSVDSL